MAIKARRYRNVWIFFPILFIILFQLINHYSFAQNVQQDSTKLTIKQNIDVTKSKMDTTLANKYFSTAEKLAKAAQFDSSNFYFEKASVIYEKVADQINIDRIWEKYISSLYSIGKNWLTKGNYADAESYFNKGLKVALDKLGSEHLAVANGYQNVGIARSYSKGDYDKVLELFNKALSIKIKKLGEKDPRIAMSFMNIGAIYDIIGNYNKSLELYNKSLSISKLNNDSLNLAKIYLNLGVVCAEKNDYDQAMEFYHQSLLLFEKLGNLPWVAWCYNNIGNVYTNKKDYNNALESHQKALSLRTKIFGNVHPSISASYSNIGIIYSEKKDFDNSLEFLNKAVSLNQELFGVDHLAVTANYHNIGTIYKKKKEYEKALEFLNKCLAIKNKFFGEIHPEIAVIYNSIGQVYFDQNKVDSSLYYYQKALNSLFTDFRENDIYKNPSPKNVFSERILFDSFILKAEAFYKLYTLNSTEKDLRMSLATYKLAMDLIDLMRSGFKAEGSKLFLAEHALKTYDNAIQVALNLYNTTNDEKYKEKAFYFVEKSKSNILLESIWDAQAKQFAGIPDSLLDYEQELRINLAFYHKSLAEEQLKGSNADSLKIVLWQEKIFTLNQEYESLNQQLEIEYPNYYNLKYQIKTPSIPDIQKELLYKKATLLEYFIGDSLIFIFTITPENLDIDVVEKGNLEQLVDTLRLALTKERTHFENYTRSAFALYQKLIQPIKDKIANQNLIIIPDGILGHLPFEALLTKPASLEKKDFQNLAYLIKDHAIKYTYSANLVLEKGGKRQATGKDYVAYAPVFSKNSPIGYVDSTTAPQLLIVQREYNPEDAILRGSNIQMLKYSELEVNNIYNLYKKKKLKAKMYLFDQANEKNFKTADLANFNYIHISSHGVVNEIKPELSGILFAQDTTLIEDGTLYSGEVFNLQLNADLVVLSACETGLGKIVRGEGIIGLTRGFLYAGAKSLVVSLWKVDDRSTSNLMIDFYKNLINDVPKSESLRDAKLNLIKNKNYASPYFWSPFILIGN